MHVAEGSRACACMYVVYVWTLIMDRACFTVMTTNHNGNALRQISFWHEAVEC